MFLELAALTEQSKQPVLELGRDVLSKLLPQEEKRNVKSWTLGFETPEAISSIIELKPARGKKPSQQYD